MPEQIEVTIVEGVEHLEVWLSDATSGISSSDLANAIAPYGDPDADFITPFNTALA